MKTLADEWEDFENEIFTHEEIVASDLRVAIIGELIRARNENGLSQMEVEELSGVITKMENGELIPQLENVLKVLAPLGKTLAVVPIEST